MRQVDRVNRFDRYVALPNTQPTQIDICQAVEFGCPLLAVSGHFLLHRECPLSGVKRTWLFAAQMSAFDPMRTLDGKPQQVGRFQHV
jgi:hypothetical protein